MHVAASPQAQPPPGFSGTLAFRGHQEPTSLGWLRHGYTSGAIGLPPPIDLVQNPQSPGLGLCSLVPKRLHLLVLPSLLFTPLGVEALQLACPFLPHPSHLRL